MGFLWVERGGIWEPNLSKRPQPWYQRIFCKVLGHDWIAKEWSKTGKVVFDHGFSPVHEMARLCTCNRCHAKTWRDGQYWGLEFDRYNRQYHADDYRYDESGWPLAADGSRLPLSDRPNRTGW